MSDQEEKGRKINQRSLENLKLGAEARRQGKVRRNTTLLPETIAWLKEQGNLSEAIERLVASAKSGLLSFKSDDTHIQKRESFLRSSDNTHSSIVNSSFTHWNVYESVEEYDHEQKKDIWGEWKFVSSHKTEYSADQWIEKRTQHNYRMNSAKDYGVLRLRYEKRHEVILPAGEPPASWAIERAGLEARSLELTRTQSLLAQTQAELEKAQSGFRNLVQLRYEMEDELASVKALLDECKQQSQSVQPMPDLEAVRDRVVNRWRIQKRAESRERVKEALDKFIVQLQQTNRCK